LSHQSVNPAPDSEELAPACSYVTQSESALLVASETNPHPLDTQSAAQEAIHHAVEKFRFLIIEAMHTSPDADLQRRAEKMGLCCVSPQVFADADSIPVCVAGYCRDRLCPTCMRRRAWKVRVRLIGLVSSMNAPRFLTLTERDNADPLGKRMDRITAAVRKLRHTKAWKRHVKGGVMVWETTRNEKAGTWHPHVHLIIDGDYWAHSEVLAEWKKALGGDGAARIEACHDRNRSARYLSKYLAKDAEVAAWKFNTICEFATAMHRRRLVATFGAMHKLNVDLCDEERPKPQLPRASLGYAQIRDAIAAGNEVAQKAAPLLARLGIAFRQLFSSSPCPLSATQMNFLPHNSVIWDAGLKSFTRSRCTMETRSRRQSLPKTLVLACSSAMTATKRGRRHSHRDGRRTTCQGHDVRLGLSSRWLPPGPMRAGRAYARCGSSGPRVGPTRRRLGGGAGSTHSRPAWSPPAPCVGPRRAHTRPAGAAIASPVWAPPRWKAGQSPGRYPKHATVSPRSALGCVAAALLVSGSGGDPTEPRKTTYEGLRGESRGAGDGPGATVL